MGLNWSSDEPDPNVVLVPPLFERDHKARSRMAKSSYDYLFCRPALRWLFNDYMLNGARGVLFFSPAEDPRLSIKARFATSIDKLGDKSSGSLALRFQADPAEQYNFFDIKASTSETGSAQLRGCYFDPETGFGVFGCLPLQQAAVGRVGLRYSSQSFAAGAITSTERLSKVWLVSRQGPLTFGVQYNGSPPLQPLQAWSPSTSVQSGQIMQGLSSLQDRLSYSVSYSPEGSPTVGRGGGFTASVEVKEQRQLLVSFFHHMAVQRNCHNPFEDGAVVGITNYIDVGLQLISSLQQSQPQLMGSPSEGPSLRLAGSWQANKNVMAKARVGTDGAAVCLAFKSWWQPSFWLAASASFDPRRQIPKLGLSFGTENFGNLRYERSVHKGEMRGKGLVQRHVALPEDVANSEGKGLLVRESNLDNPVILGQTQPAGAFLL